MKSIRIGRARSRKWRRRKVRRTGKKKGKGTVAGDRGEIGEEVGGTTPCSRGLRSRA